MENNQAPEQEKKITASLAIICIILAVFIFTKINKNTEPIEVKYEIAEPKPTESKPSIVTNDDIYVYLCGAVNKAGVYKVPKGTILAQAVRLSGGVTEKADLERINLAKILKNEEKVKIPEKQTKEITQSKNENKNEEETKIQEISLALPDDLIDINTADQKTLESIPGIGAVTAGKIISYRENSGRFNSFEDLESIPGIRKKTIEKCRNYIFIE